MHPEDADRDAVQAAKRVCQGCPVQAECLNEAIAGNVPHGVWGGFVRAERQRLARGAAARLCTDCGLWFVPRLLTQHRCTPCALTVHARPHAGVRPASLEPHRDLITRLAGEGMSDARIAGLLGAGVTKKRVYLSRERWGVRAGRKTLGAAARSEVA